MYGMMNSRAMPLPIHQGSFMTGGERKARVKELKLSFSVLKK